MANALSTSTVVAIQVLARATNPDEHDHVPKRIRMEAPITGR